MDRLRIMIVDDHHLFRRGLRDVILNQKDMDVVAEASNGREAVDLALRFKPELILMDVNLPEGDGIEVTRRISALLDSTRIVMLTVSSLEEHLFEAVKAGAFGYLTKDVSPEELISVIRSVQKGEAPLSPQMTAKILEFFRDQPTTGTAAVLTSREDEVLGFLSRGYRDKEIAGELGISMHTVKKHVQNILRKLQVKKRSEAASAHSRIVKEAADNK